MTYYGLPFTKTFQMLLRRLRIKSAMTAKGVSVVLYLERQHPTRLGARAMADMAANCQLLTENCQLNNH